MTVCRDLDAVHEAWRERRPGEVGVLHLGFDRPPSDAFDQVASDHPDRMLLTASARYGLPRGFAAHPTPVGDIDGLPVYLATRGFGYAIDTELPMAGVPLPPTPNARAPQGWLAMFVAEVPNDAAALVAADVDDDESYLANEHNLDRGLRQRLGAFRFKYLIGGDDSDPARIARCAPPWLQATPIKQLPLTVRIANGMHRENVTTVSDLIRFEPLLLLSASNFGRKSFNQLADMLHDALRAGPTTEEDAFVAAELVTMLEGMRATLVRLGDRERDIVVRRMGLYSPAETLAQIGETFGVTRERIRQIEAKVVKRIVHDEHWDDLLTRKLEHLLDGRDHPLPVIGVEAIDPWFAGIADNGDVVSYILENMCGDHFHVVRVDDVPYFARFDQERWVGCQREARAILKANANAGWDEAHCQAVVCGILDVGAREFGALLWEVVNGDCHFSVDGERRILSSYGKSVEAIVEAVLSDSPIPLHYSEIATAAALRTDRELEPLRIHAAAQAVGHLFGRGQYGLAKHCPVEPETRAACVAEVERIVREGPADRQWHCAELCKLLAVEGLEEEGLDKYALNMFLKQSPTLERLGRLTWAAKAESGQVARTDIRKAIIAILRDAGGPLSSSEITARLDAVRGTNQSIAIWNFEPVIRVRRGVWGLNDRDLGISREQQSRVFDTIVERLSDAGEGIHVSDLLEGFPELARFDVDADLLCSLAVHHPQVRVNGERFLYLPAWGDARRERTWDAISAILAASDHGITFDDLIVAFAERTGRAPDSRRISGMLQKIGSFALATGRWTARKDTAADDFDDDVAITTVPPPWSPQTDRLPAPFADQGQQ